MSLSGNKDIDRKILNLVTDNDIKKICRTNKYLNSLCDNDFFYRRMLERYPYAIDFKPIDLNWREYYLTYLNFKKKVKSEFDFDFRQGNFKQYYDILSLGKIYKKNNNTDKLWTILMSLQENDLKDYIFDLLH